jgi:hypothetical protein
MDGSRFDQLARGMAAGSSRRTLLKALGGGVVAALGLVRAGGRVDADNTCKPAAPKPQSKCTKDGQCCAGLVCQTGNCKPGCRINGTFYASGAPNPTNQCQACQPSVSTTRFSNKSNGTTCNDSNACTQTDTCQAGVCIGGNPVVCTAIDQCHNAGTCNPANGQCSNPAKPDGTTCNDGNASTCTDVCIDGTCAGAATGLQTDANNCGTCGHVCGANQHCAAGACACENGYTACQTRTGLTCSLGTCCLDRRDRCCDSGLLDRLGDCCDNGVFDIFGFCCPSGVFDALGSCCFTGVLNNIGLCCCDGSTPGEDRCSTGDFPRECSH